MNITASSRFPLMSVDFIFADPWSSFHIIPHLLGMSQLCLLYLLLVVLPVDLFLLLLIFPDITHCQKILLELQVFLDSVVILHNSILSAPSLEGVGILELVPPVGRSLPSGDFRLLHPPVDHLCSTIRLEVVIRVI